MFKNMSGDIPGGNFLGWNFPDGNFPGGDLMVGNFPGGSLPDTSQTTYFDVFCLNFSIETKMKTLFLISYFNLSKKRNVNLGTQTMELFEKIVNG